MAFRNEYLSFSRLSRYESCPLSFKLHYIDRFEAEPGVPLRFGKMVHAVLERLLREVIEEERTSPLSEARAFELLQEAWIEERLAGVDIFTEALDIVKDFVRAEGIVDHRDVLAVEKEFHLPVGPFSVLGFIDRVDRVDDETVRIIDYKTNRVLFTREEVDTSLQLSLYALAAKRLWPWAKKIELVFDMLRHGVKLRTERTEEQLQTALQYIETLGRATETVTEFPPQLGPNCIYCDHSARCPAYADALAGKRYEVATDPADLDGLGREREEIGHVVKILEGRKRELDSVIKARLKGRDELVLAGVRYAMFKVSKVAYPLAPTLDAVARATGLPESDLVAKLATIDKDALDALVKELGGHLEKSKVLMLRAELEAVAEKTFTPRLWAKQVPA
jgi:RecB family exonuclease